MKIDWHNIGTAVGVSIAIGGTIVALLRGFFQTKHGCEDTQERFRKNRRDT
jgi:hypothetical protein